jgi:hypothetical protein
MIKYWHIWSDSKEVFLESLVEELTTEDSLIIFSAEEAYFPSTLLIEKTIPLKENGWPESFGNYKNFLSNLKKLKSVDIVIGTNDTKVVDDYSNMGTVHIWNNFFLYRSFLYFNKKSIVNNTVNKLFISLNTKAHYHRCLLIDLLAKYDLHDNGILSWHNEPSGWDDHTYQWKYWNPKILSFDKNYNPVDQNRIIKQHCLPNEINDAFLVLISETYVNHFFITEKTWHAILAEKPFLVYGSVGFHNKLQEMGFELYNDIFDYSFDSESDAFKRAEMIVQELKRIETLSFIDMHITILNKLKNNKIRALEMIKDLEGVPIIARNFEKYSYVLENIKND